jgi:hypothetical protein
MKISYGIVAVRRGKEDRILHFCGYSKKPTETDFNSLRVELENDLSFGLVGNMDSIDLLPAPPEVVRRYARMYAERPE